MLELDKTIPTGSNLPTIIPSASLVLYRTQTTVKLLHDVVQEGSAEYWYELGKKASEGNKWSESIYYYDCAIKLTTNDFRFYHNRGAAKLELQNYSEADADFDQAIEIRCNEHSYVNKGNIRRKLMQYNDANYYYELAIKLNPRFAMAYFNRGLAHKDQMHLPEAIMDFNYAIHLEPKMHSAYYSRALIEHLHLNNYANAIADYTIVLDLVPTNIWAYFQRGNALSRLENHVAALSDYNAALSITKDDFMMHILYRSRGAIREKIGDSEGAEKDNKEAERLRLKLDTKSSQEEAPF